LIEASGFLVVVDLAIGREIGRIERCAAFSPREDVIDAICFGSTTGNGAERVGPEERGSEGPPLAAVVEWVARQSDSLWKMAGMADVYCAVHKSLTVN